MDQAFRLILASGSPRRRALLSEAGYDFEVIVSDAEESADPALGPEELAKHNASAKAITVAQSLPADQAATPALVIGADTIVVQDGRVFGKPADEQAARETLHALSGAVHQVVTGVCLVCGDAYLAFSETTQVRFRELDEETIGAYIATGEPLDKAGAYGIQGKGGALGERIEGDFDNVVGLPVARLVARLDRLGVPRRDGATSARS